MENQTDFILEVNEGGESWELVEASSDEEYVKSKKELYEWKNAGEIQNLGWKFRIVRATTTYEVMEETK